MIILSDDFQRFVLKAGRIMERALWEQEDIYTDYIGGGEIDEAAYVCCLKYNTIHLFMLINMLLT